MSENKNWRDHDNGMTVHERLKAMAELGYDVTGVMCQIAKVSSVAAAFERDRRIAELEAQAAALVAERDRLKELRLFAVRHGATAMSQRDAAEAERDQLKAERDRMRAALLDAGAALGQGGCTAIKCDSCEAESDYARHSIYEGLGVAGYSELMVFLAEEGGAR